jgi:suppressor for copper-sensitivity B
MIVEGRSSWYNARAIDPRSRPGWRAIEGMAGVTGSAFLKTMIGLVVAAILGCSVAAADGVIGVPAEPGASASLRTEQSEARLLAATDALGPDGRVQLGLQFRLQPHWKVYWRSPGAAGYAPRLDWSGSRNLESAAMHWPAPQRFSVLGLETLGYTDEVVFPLELRAKSAAEPLAILLRVDYLICEEICIPYSATLDLTILPGETRTTAFAPLIERARAAVPGDGARAGWALAESIVAGRPGEETLRLAIDAKSPFAKPDLFIEGPDSYGFGTFSIRVEGTRVMADVPVIGISPTPTSLAGQSVTVTLVDGARAAEWTSAVNAANIQPIGWARFLGILGLALLGGLILNLMPCVLPVLSIKLLGMVGLGGRARGVVRRRFLASAAGILFSFLILAGGVLVARTVGHAVGWGIQFQQPLFLIAMTLILTVFACNLWGVFEFRLPYGIADRAAQVGRDDGLLGHFLTGALATILATPCSAPFLGTAVGFALARGPFEILAVFVALGLGLALPYLAVAAMPGLAMRLPHPGHWMVTLRRVLGIALIATAAWLLVVLASARGLAGALIVAGGLVSLVAFLWATRRSSAAIGWAGMAVIAALALLSPQFVAGRPDPASPARGVIAWQPFDAEAIPSLVAQGKVVFVDVTADWCLTCKVNARFVLETEDVARALNGEGVVAMRADWTNPDAGIAAFLARFGRYGIPFNAVYGPSQAMGIVLPELLDRDTVLESLARAARSG